MTDCDIKYDIINAEFLLYVEIIFKTLACWARIVGSNFGQLHSFMSLLVYISSRYFPSFSFPSLMEKGDEMFEILGISWI